MNTSPPQILKDWVFNKGAVEDTARLSMVKAYAMLQDGDVAQATQHTDNAVNQTLQRYESLLQHVKLSNSVDSHQTLNSDTSACRSITLPVLALLCHIFAL